MDLKFRKALARAIVTAVGILMTTFSGITHAQIEPRQLAVEVTAAVTLTPAQVRLVWPSEPNATGYTISRRGSTSSNWTSIATLDGSVNEWIDTNVSVGGSYEYQIAKSSSLGVTAFGYILTGLNAPLIENRGKLVLIVDSTHASELAVELARLQKDMIGDGWTVIRHDISPSASVATVKGLIKADYSADPANVKAVLLFGHVPVPRSGDINPDGHPNHLGAWAADSFYGDMDGTWTDSTVNDTSAERADNFNVPGDGRFDQSEIPSDLELAVGRVDLSNMTCYANKTPPRSEIDLLRQYLNKDHAFRHGSMAVARRGVVADNFGYIDGEACAAGAWGAFAAMFGSTNTTALSYGTYFPTLTNQSYLFSYASGGGGYYTCDGIGSSDDFALNAIQTVFTTFFGSYFGDWDNESNFLRASLGSGSTLTAAWSGRPIYFFHRMALGETVGECARVSANNGVGGPYQPQYYGSRYVNNGLLGDPTLRLHPVLPGSNLTATINNGLALSWTASSDSAIQGYNVYRATSGSGPVTRLNNTLLPSTSYTDTAPPSNGVYMVRAVKLESTPSGTYLNPSQGIFYTNTFQAASSPTNASRFVKSDVATRGNWKGVYGIEGNWMAGVAPALPTYAGVTTTSPQWIWATQTASSFAPALPGSSTNRIAACWYSAAQVSFDFSIRDAQLHRVSVYFLDWTASGRQERVDLIDRDTGLTIDSRTLNNFSTGIYLTWDIIGNVSIRLTPSNVNAVASAIFFDATPPSTAARFVKSDSTTRGNWMGIYGSDASIIARDSARNASYATVSVRNQSEWTYATDGKDARALLKNDGTNRIAGVWYSQYPTTNSFNIDMTIADGATHQVALYALDWYNQGRALQVDVLNADSGAVLDSRQLSAYNTGVYLVWDIRGRIRLRLSTLAGANAMASGIFLGPPSSPL